LKNFEQTMFSGMPPSAAEHRTVRKRRFLQEMRAMKERTALT